LFCLPGIGKARCIARFDCDLWDRKEFRTANAVGQKLDVLCGSPVCHDVLLGTQQQEWLSRKRHFELAINHGEEVMNMRGQGFAV
jgi:hypothetical protein